MTTSNEENADDTAALRATNVKIADWEQHRDPEAIERLDEILSPDLLFRRADKSVVGKQEFMSALTGPSPFRLRESQDVSVSRQGERALVTLTVIATKTDGTVGRYRNIRVFFRRDGKWQLEVWFNDDVTNVTGL